MLRFLPSAKGLPILGLWVLVTGEGFFGDAGLGNALGIRFRRGSLGTRFTRFREERRHLNGWEGSRFQMYSLLLEG